MYSHYTLRKAKLQSGTLAYIYYLLAKETGESRYFSRSLRVSNCSVFWSGKKCTHCGTLHSMHTYGCKDRLCPICATRKSRAIAAQAMQILPGILDADKTRTCILVTLTVKNVHADSLSAALDGIIRAWDTIKDYRVVRSSMVAWARNIEVTRNPSNGTYHPHVHVLAVVTSEELTSFVTWKALWKNANNLDYSPIVDVRPVTSSQGIYEVSKYVSKLGLMLGDHLGAAFDTVKTLAGVVYRRRLRSFGGEWAKARRNLKMKDVDSLDDGELDQVANSYDDEECSSCGASLLPVVLSWSGLTQDYSESSRVLEV